VIDWSNHPLYDPHGSFAHRGLIPWTGSPRRRRGTPWGERRRKHAVFRILADDARFPDRWFLDEPLTKDGVEIDAREFCYGCPYLGPVPVDVPIQYPGRKVAFNLAAFDMPVVRDEIAGLLEKIDRRSVECFPLTVGTSMVGYVILNVRCREACVDEQRSLITRWRPEEGRPDKVGRYRMVSNLTIDPSRTHDRHIFRVEDFAIALIVSEVIRQALEELLALGVVFKPVC
jgi:hypothetical protein